MTSPFDAVLLVAFGGPSRMADVRPFLENVVRGRRVPAARLDEVASHYARFDGVSPLRAITMRQALGIEERLAERGLHLPVYVGMRNWHPFLTDTLAAMSTAGVRRAIAFIMAPHRSFSSCTQYRRNVDDARNEMRRCGLRDVEVTYVGDWHTHPKFVEANAAHVRTALSRLPSNMRPTARLVFTAHSLPEAMPGARLYRDQVIASASAVAAAVGSRDWVVTFQSRSGAPGDPWLGPDVCDYVRDVAGTVPAVALVPIGFVADHIEVLYDLDGEAADVCREAGVPMVRAESVNDSPIFLEMAAELVSAVHARYRSGRPLPIV